MRVLNRTEVPTRVRSIMGRLQVWFPHSGQTAIAEDDVAGRTRLGVDAFLAAGGVIEVYTPPAPTWADVVAKRDSLLAASDVRVLPDRWAAMTAEQQKAWAAYRQALRDLPGDRSGDPAKAVLPTALSV